MRKYWKTKYFLHKIIQGPDEEGIACKVQQKDDSKAKTRVLHRSTLMRCYELLENFDLNKPYHNKKTCVHTKIIKN